jgi:DNA-binding NtrC family response regulator
MGLSPEARRCLMSYGWPGNVRELENAVERAVVLGTTDRVQPEDLPETLLERASQTALGGMKYYELVKEAKKQIILDAFNQTGSYNEAATLLGLHTNNLHRLIRNLDIKSSLGKQAAPKHGDAAQKTLDED